VEYLKNPPIFNSFPPREKEATSFPFLLKEKDNKIHLPPLGGEYPQGDGGIILNLDLDFFQKDLDYIDYELKKKVILDAADKAKVITVSTSPFFIEQDKAIKVFKDIFYT
jgi:hypothetical protein